MSAEDLEGVLQRASDHDPQRLHTEMWPAIEALAEEAGVEVPPPLVTKTFMLEVDARFPAHGEFQLELSRRLHEVIANEYMESSGELHGYSGPFVQRIHSRVEDGRGLTGMTTE